MPHGRYGCGYGTIDALIRLGCWPWPAATGRKTHGMTTKIALWLGGIILALVALDFFAFGGEYLLFLARRWLELLEYVAFWR